jgi:hypothetical protein
MIGECEHRFHSGARTPGSMQSKELEVDMAGIAHAGVGLAAKQVAPKTPLVVLVTAAYVIDMIWGIFFFAGIEHLYWSHSLLMALLWSLLAGVLTALVSRSRRSGLIIGLLVFSHWVVDFISHPMTAVFPEDTGLPLLFENSPTVGLGVWRTQLGVNMGEYGTLLLGFVLYVLALRKIRREKRTAKAPEAIREASS